MNLPREPLRQGAVGVIVRQGKFLVIRRSQSVVAPGMICFPGGGLEGSESEAAALVRELQEELGVTVRPLRRVWHSITPWRVELFWWQASLSDDAVICPNSAEVAEIAWLTAAEMAALPDLLASNHLFLQALASGEIELRDSDGSTVGCR